MGKKVLIVASVVSFIEWFNKENVEYLKNDLKCEVHIACNFDYMDDTNIERTQKYIKKITDEGVILHNILFARSPLGKGNRKAYKQLKRLINEGHFDLVHCHTPTVSIMTRLAAKKARKQGTIIMYTCHGFHFHNAAPLKNWMLYYPIEKFFSRYCDYIITINKEDYNRAKTFHCKKVRYIPGVGVDIKTISNIEVDKEAYKESIGIPRDCVMLLSIGELIERKNHEVIVKALGKLKNPGIYYVICGKGPLKEYLYALAKKEGIENNVIFLGFRTDIPELCKTADISVFPSKIEGLGLAGIEAMAAGVPLVSSNVHGILDYVVDGKTGYACKPDDVDGFKNAIDKLVSSKELRDSMRYACLKAVEPFEKNNALNAMWNIYKEVLEENVNE
ncbi:MAG: glycosyltransferase family 4 protein [Christensenellaceae bacterium]